MLYQINPGPDLDAMLAALNPEYPLLMKCWLAWGEQGLPRIRLVDNLSSPRVFVGGVADWINIIGQEASLQPALDDLLAGRTDPGEIWPDEHTRACWSKQPDGQPYIRLEGHGEWVHASASGLGLGEVENKTEEDGAYFYYFTGAPRFAGEVKHPCRVVNGLELCDLMRQGTDYDESGVYTRQCLEAGPSFVCEIDGEPVCWSCTHVGRALGMIYTPKEHRRKGYARSLAALQIDHMLKVDRLAWCAILGSNLPSQGMIESFGAQRMAGRMYWRRFTLPGNTAVAGGG